MSTATSPGVGRQDQNKDPIGFAGGDTNVYAYVGNDPVNLVDLTGLRPLTTNEKNFLLRYYGASLDVEAIDVSTLPSIAEAANIGGMNPFGDKILLPSKHFKGADSDNEVDLGNLSSALAFAHESLHVWQRQHGDYMVSPDGLLLGLARILVDPYAYTANSSHEAYISFLSGCIEQQARIFEHFVMADLQGNSRGRAFFAEIQHYVRSM